MASPEELKVEMRRRLRRSAPPGVVGGGLPVLFFGNIWEARVATVGLNPSKLEYLDPRRSELEGEQRRFESLRSLEVEDRASLTDQQCGAALDRMRDYFLPGRPVLTRWFRPLMKVIGGMGLSYEHGDVVHLDLVQEPTIKGWSDLDPTEWKALLADDLPFLLWELESFPISTVICNGATPLSDVLTLLGAKVVHSEAMKLVKLTAARARLGNARYRGAGLEPATGSANRFGRRGHGRPWGMAARMDDRLIDSKSETLDRLVSERGRQVGGFMRWAAEQEGDRSNSLRWSERSDIPAAQQAASLFPEQWWGLTVFTCFWWKQPIAEVVEAFHRPMDPNRARKHLDRMKLPHGSVSHHRTQRGHTGARNALVGACEQSTEFKRILTEDIGWLDPRFQAVWDLPAGDWGRTTSYDLILRAGALGVGGHLYAPELAYLEGSTGPARGFKLIWGVGVQEKGGAWCEALLAAWINRWPMVANAVDVKWTGKPYDAGDLENALCIYQEKGPPCD